MSEARQIWNKADIDETFIRDNYDKMSARQIGEILGVSRELINHRVRALGLRKTKIPYTPLDGEVLASIKGISEYAVSNKSRVVNLKEMTLVKPKIDREGYWKVTLFTDGKRLERRLHRIVAEAFIPNPLNLPFVNHIDGDKTNAEITNLEWVTPKGNAEHAAELGLLARGESSPKAKITETQAMSILADALSGLSTQQLLQRHPYATKSIITKIANRSRWKHLSCTS